MSFDWSGKTSNSIGKVWWNGVVIANLNPSDQDIHTVTITVNANAGNNILIFEAVGNENTERLTLDNIKLISKCDPEDRNPTINYVQNGGF